jgi:DNA adenine methylase
MGGKYLLANTIVSQFPADIKKYIEVFGGGGSVLFAREKHAKTEIYNDLNSNLVNLFRCIKHQAGELQKEIGGYLNSREMFYDARERIDCRGNTDIQRAAMFFILVKTSYAADVRSYGCGKSNCRIATDDFEKFKERLAGVAVENKDFENLIKQYDSEDSFFYCDPPYYTTERHYAEKFAKSDHQRLKNCLDGIKGKFLLSYNDHEFVRGLYSGYDIIAVERQNNISSGKYKELIIKNY